MRCEIEYWKTVGEFVNFVELDQFFLITNVGNRQIVGFPLCMIETQVYEGQLILAQCFISKIEDENDHFTSFLCFQFPDLYCFCVIATIDAFGWIWCQLIQPSKLDQFISMWRVLRNRFKVHCCNQWCFENGPERELRILLYRRVKRVTNDQWLECI